MATLKEFEEALRAQGNTAALEVLEGLRERDRKTRKMAGARRVTGRKMTSDLAFEILRLHETTGMTQQEIAFELGVNQGRVNEVVKRGKWLDDDPHADEAVARDRALARIRGERPQRPPRQSRPKAPKAPRTPAPVRREETPQLSLF